MRVDAFDFDLPEERIAIRPASPRDSARMLVVRPGDGLTDSDVGALPTLLKSGDVLVFNDTKVIPAQLEGVRVRDGSARAHVGATLHMRTGPDRWKAFIRGAKKLKTGDIVEFGTSAETCELNSLNATVGEKGTSGEVELVFEKSGAALDEAIAAQGHIPLPPYIASKRAEDARDRQDYQTIYAREEGAVAAPTAGLHFTPEILSQCEERGVRIARITLHVGIGTFRPVSAERLDDHVMHSEWCEIDETAADTINAARKAGGRIIAVGTTSVRTLESVAATGSLRAWQGETDLFIRPPYDFRVVDAILTNFHLPKSTLLVLVSAFAGRDLMLQAYREAVASEYRFFSYGDAMFLT